MSKIGDERVAFYLANRRQIDEWARLSVDAAIDALLTRPFRAEA